MYSLHRTVSGTEICGVFGKHFCSAGLRCLTERYVIQLNEEVEHGAWSEPFENHR